MKLKSEVNLKVNCYGELNITEGNNYKIYNGHWGESNIGTPELFLSMIKMIIPEDCTAELYRNKMGIIIKCSFYQILFEFEFNKNGVKIFYKENPYRIFSHSHTKVVGVLTYKTEFNSLNFFKQLLSLAYASFKENKFKDNVLKLYPKAEEIYTYHGDFGTGTMKLDGQRLFFRMNADQPKIESIVEEDSEGEYDLLNKQSILEKIKRLREQYQLLDSLIEKEVTPVVVKTDAELEIERKERNEARKLIPRIPELREKKTIELLNELRRSRTPGFYYDSRRSYDTEDIKAELSHREHVPTSKSERKAIRQNKATQARSGNKSKKRWLS